MADSSLHKISYLILHTYCLNSESRYFNSILSDVNFALSDFNCIFSDFYLDNY